MKDENRDELKEFKILSGIIGEKLPELPDGYFEHFSEVLITRIKANSVSKPDTGKVIWMGRVAAFCLTAAAVILLLIILKTPSETNEVIIPDMNRSEILASIDVSDFDLETIVDAFGSKVLASDDFLSHGDLADKELRNEILNESDANDFYNIED